MMRWYAGGMHPLGWVMMILFWIALIALIVWLVMRLIPAGGSRRDVTGPPAPPPVLPPGAPAPESPFDILDRRFARGEVDLETYRAQRSALIEARGGER